MVYRWCVVPQCKNTTTKTPEKLFINVPKKAKIRKKWLQLARRDPNDIVVTSSVYFCEDHFDLEKTILNYNQYKMGFSERLHIEAGVLPSKFTCQQDLRKRLCHSSTSRGAYIKTQRLPLIQECIENTRSIMKNTTEMSNQVDDNEIHEAVTSQSIEPPQTHHDKGINTQPTTADKSVQINLRMHYRSKAVQTMTVTKDYFSLSPCKTSTS